MLQKNVEWRFQGACVDDPDPDRWFSAGEIGAYNLNLTNVNTLKSVCSTCPVIAECLAHALDHEAWGVWGGTTPNERVRLRKQEGIDLRGVA